MIWLLLTAVAQAAVASEESVGAPRPVPLGETVVTATRLPRPQSEVPATVTILPREEIDRSPSQTADELLRILPSFSTFRRSSSLLADPTSQGVNLRALGPSGVSRTLVLLDGAPVNDAFGGWVYWRGLPRLGLDRVEVAPGAGSALYGSSALGGVVQLFSASLSRNRVEADASYGNFDSWQLGARGTLRARAVGAALEIESLSTEGYPVVSASQRGAIDGNAASAHLTGNARVEWSVAPRWQLNARLGAFGEEQSGGTTFTRAGVRLLRAGLGSRWTGPNGQAVTLSLFGDLERFRQTRARVGPSRNTESEAARQRVPAGQVGALGLWNLRPLGSHYISVGLEARHARGRAYETLSPPASSANAVVARHAGGAQSFLAVFAEDVWLLSAALETVAGLRVDGWQNHAGGAEATRADGTSDAERFGSRWEKQLNPRLAARWRVLDGLTLRASAARAFRAPTLNELYRPFQVGTVITAANAGLRAERAWTAELGADLRLGTPVVARLTGFGASLSDPVTNVTLLGRDPTGAQRQRQNLGMARLWGVELGVEARLPQHLIAMASYTLSDARIADGGGQPALHGNWLSQAPRHRATAGLAWVHPRWGLANLQVRWVGAQFEDDLNTLPLPPFAVLDLFLARPVWRGLELFASGENLLNRGYLVGRAGVDTIGPPRTFRVGMRLRQ